ncbi:hypothetical protein IMZ48_40075 [Candidatus Bathyarchaeota archaeon]|nr:hypothetical protein [Candidatus Bathyarchaeota archaeon]
MEATWKHQNVYFFFALTMLFFGSQDGISLPATSVMLSFPHPRHPISDPGREPRFPSTCPETRVGRRSFLLTILDNDG